MKITGSVPPRFLKLTKNQKHALTALREGKVEADKLCEPSLISLMHMGVILPTEDVAMFATKHDMKDLKEAIIKHELTCYRIATRLGLEDVDALPILTSTLKPNAIKGWDANDIVIDSKKVAEVLNTLCDWIYIYSTVPLDTINEELPEIPSLEEIADFASFVLDIASRNRDSTDELISGIERLNSLVERGLKTAPLCHRVYGLLHSVLSVESSIVSSRPYTPPVSSPIEIRRPLIEHMKAFEA
eukprot:GHVO01052838.1.p1 GENE.GHVO01052838.1~~GHVO01052838.1.p1  ORF type:complete len:244 (+),score=30.31 GHVO01052838.1:19-750(+)